MGSLAFFITFVLMLFIFVLILTATHPALMKPP